jgi:hypothetical protein
MNKIGIESRQITAFAPKSSTQIRYPTAEEEEGQKDVTIKYGVMRVRAKTSHWPPKLFHFWQKNVGQTLWRLVWPQKCQNSANKQRKTSAMPKNKRLKTRNYRK